MAHTSTAQTLIDRLREARRIARGDRSQVDQEFCCSSDEQERSDLEWTREVGQPLDEAIAFIEGWQKFERATKMFIEATNMDPRDAVKT